MGQPGVWRLGHGSGGPPRWSGRPVRGSRGPAWGGDMEGQTWGPAGYLGGPELGSDENHPLPETELYCFSEKKRPTSGFEILKIKKFS